MGRGDVVCGQDTAEATDLAADGRVSRARQKRRGAAWVVDLPDAEVLAHSFVFSDSDGVAGGQRIDAVDALDGLNAEQASDGDDVVERGEGDRGGERRRLLDDVQVR